MLKAILFAVAAAVAVSGCQKEPDSPTTQAGTPAISADTMTASSAGISITPDSTQSCAGVIANVSWNAENSGAHTDSTEVFVGLSEADSGVFTAGGNSGKAATGPWARPGMHFILKDKMNGKVLAQTVMKGPHCL